MKNKKYFVISLLIFIIGIVFLVAGIFCMRYLPSGLLEAQTLREEFLVGGATIGIFFGIVCIISAAMVAVMGMVAED